MVAGGRGQRFCCLREGQRNLGPRRRLQRRSRRPILSRAARGRIWGATADLVMVDPEQRPGVRVQAHPDAKPLRLQARSGAPLRRNRRHPSAKSEERPALRLDPRSEDWAAGRCARVAARSCESSRPAAATPPLGASVAGSAGQLRCGGGRRRVPRVGDDAPPFGPQPPPVPGCGPLGRTGRRGPPPSRSRRGVP